MDQVVCDNEYQHEEVDEVCMHEGRARRYKYGMPYGSNMTSLFYQQTLCLVLCRLDVGLACESTSTPLKSLSTSLVTRPHGKRVAWKHCYFKCSAITMAETTMAYVST